MMRLVPLALLVFAIIAEARRGGAPRIATVATLVPASDVVLTEFIGCFRATSRSGLRIVQVMPRACGVPPVTPCGVKVTTRRVISAMR